MDEFPVHDENHLPSPKKRALTSGASHLANIDQLEQQAVRERQLIGKWDRAVIEDKYLKLQEDNLLLKRHARKQEEKLKKFAVKLVRLNSDKKKAESAAAAGPSKKVSKDVTKLEEKIEELKVKLYSSEAEKANLQRSVSMLQNQVALAPHKSQAVGEVQSRIDSGVKKDPVSSRKNIRVMGPAQGRTKTSPVPQVSAGNYARYGHSLLEEARDANTQLKKGTRAYEIERLKQDLNYKDREIEGLHEQMRLREAKFEDDILQLKRQATGAARSNIQENIDLMRLQREVKDKSTKLEALQAQFESLGSNLSHMKASHDALLRQLEDANSQLKQEQSRVVALQGQLKRRPPEANRIQELEEQLTSVKNENAILKEANENLVSSAFDMEREREWRQRENALKVQIAQLEATLKADLGEKGNILDRLTAERAVADRRDKEHSELQREFYRLKEQHDELKEKMRFFTKESAIDFTEIEEALVLVKQRREKEEDNLDFLGKVSEEKNKDLEKEVLMLHADHAETIEELEKTRNMLIVQHQINKDYQQEVEAVNKKMEENKSEYESKLDEYAQLLDIRAARIRKLETQMKDVAYGTRQYKVKADDEPVGSDVEEYDETIQLERGENLFEIHINKMDISREGLRILGDEEPSLFCTWEFFEFEIQSTPVVKSANPVYDFTSQYIVKVDDFFLHHLQKESTTLEVHMAVGTDYSTVASCRLRFRDIFDKPQGRVRGVADVISIQHNGAVIGSLTFWVRLKVPMDQALRLYKERMKALGYISANEKVEQTTLQALDESARLKPSDNVNQLHVKIVRCNSLKSRQVDVQPSPYCVYKFFDFPDHDTAIVTSSNSPEFNDLHTYPVTVAADLDSYLKRSTLQVYAFDDTEPDLASYLGVANIPLLPLAHDKAIKGTFELVRADGGVNGTLDVFLKWQYSYLPPPTGTKTPAQVVTSTPIKKESSLAMLPGESLDTSSLATEPTHGNQRPTAVTMEQVENYQDDLRPIRTSRAQSPPTLIKKKAVEFNLEVSTSKDGVSNRTTPAVIHQEVSSSVVSDVPSDYVSTSESLSADQLIREELGETAASSDDGAMDEVMDREKVTPVAAPRLSDDETLTAHDDTHQVPKGTGDSVPEGIQQNSTGNNNDDDDDAFDSSITDEEKTETIMNQLNNENGTYFEESAGEDDVEDRFATAGTPAAEASAADATERSDSEVPGSDSEGVVSPTPVARSLNSSISHGEMVIIEVSHLSLQEDADIMKDSSIKRLFVAYNFLGINPAELETPMSLPKPRKSHQQMKFNFRKVFHVDMDNNYEKRQHLASMLLPNSPDQGLITFMVVCEPLEEDETADCFDVGITSVSLPDILEKGANIVDANLPVYDIKNEENEIGTLNVSVQCLATLQAIQEELPSQ